MPARLTVRIVVLLPDRKRALQACRRAGKVTKSFLDTGERFQDS
jgi:hypothetical protein